jgi:hypothetical protein
VWGMPLNAEDFLNGKKVQQEMTITEKTRQAIRAGIESVNNNTGDIFSLWMRSSHVVNEINLISPGL